MSANDIDLVRSDDPPEACAAGGLLGGGMHQVSGLFPVMRWVRSHIQGTPALDAIKRVHQHAAVQNTKVPVLSTRQSMLNPCITVGLLSRNTYIQRCITVHALSHMTRRSHRIGADAHAAMYMVYKVMIAEALHCLRYVLQFLRTGSSDESLHQDLSAGEPTKFITLGCSAKSTKVIIVKSFGSMGNLQAQGPQLLWIIARATSSSA